jgi:nitric oxide synthase-interacting protein
VEVDRLAHAIFQAEALKAKLPDFWLPSLTPDAKAAVADIKDIKLQTMCHAGEPRHPLRYLSLLIYLYLHFK